MIVVDASAVLEMLLRSALGKRIEARVHAGDPVLNAPHLLDVEVLQVLRRQVGSKSIELARALGVVEDLRSLSLVRHSHEDLGDRVLELRHNLTAYDAVYLALAEALNATLVTCDGAFAKVPGVRAVVEILR